MKTFLPLAFFFCSMIGFAQNSKSITTTPERVAQEVSQQSDQTNEEKIKNTAVKTTAMQHTYSAPNCSRGFYPTPIKQQSKKAILPEQKRALDSLKHSPYLAYATRGF